MVQIGTYHRSNGADYQVQVANQRWAWDSVSHCVTEADVTTDPMVQIGTNHRSNGADWF
jgi:outer membrane phospholipase A